jgi:hypothetical protein
MNSKNIVTQDPATLMGLAYAINSCSRLQGIVVDRLRLHHAITKHEAELSDVQEQNWQGLLRKTAIEAGIEGIDWYEKPDPARLPAIAWLPELG